MTKHRPTVTPAPQWWMHLRKFWRRLYWKRDRQQAKREIEASRQ